MKLDCQPQVFAFIPIFDESVMMEVFIATAKATVFSGGSPDRKGRFECSVRFIPFLENSCVFKLRAIKIQMRIECQ